MRLSSKKGAHLALSSAAWQEIRVRFGRDDKGEGGASGKSGGWTEAIFVFVNGPKATGTPDGDDKVVELLRAAHRLEKPQFHQNSLVISTGAQRSGEICGFFSVLKAWGPQPARPPL